MGNYILFLALLAFWTLALFIPIFIFNAAKKRSNIIYVLLFIIDIILLVFAFGDLNVEGNEMANNISYAHSLIYQLIITIVTLFVLLIHSIIRKIRKPKSNKRDDKKSTEIKNNTTNSNYEI